MTSRGAGTLPGLAVLGGGTALAAVLGLGFQALMAFWFGAGAETDAFFMSLSIYGFLAKFLMLTHLKSLSLPLYSRLRVSDEEGAKAFAGGLLGISVGVVAVLSLVLLFASPLLVDALAPGYEGRMRDLTVLLLRIRVPALPFLAGTTVAMALLESERRFGVTISAQKVVPAAVSLVLLLALADRFGIVAVGWIGLASTVAGALVIWGAARSRVGSLAPVAAVRNAELRRIGGGWVSLSSSNAASFVGEWAFRVGASLLPIGLFSAVLYGRMVHDLLHSAVNDSAQTVALPRFSAALASGPAGAESGSPSVVDEAAHRKLGPVLRSALGRLTTVSLPLSLVVAATAPWSVALLFGRGRFLQDGMIGPAAVSLELFAAGFFLQGLVQLLFAAAFSTQRSQLINRVQLIGHLVRAAAIIPMVQAFSYVGLVGSQVAMNALVLGLLLFWAPREWALVRPRSSLLRSLVAAVLPVALYLTVVSPRLPDPLTVGTLGRIGVLSAIGAGWVLLYGALALALSLPGTAALSRRLRGGAPAVIALLILSAGVPRGAAAQSPAGWGPLPEAHWSLSVLEWLEARGSVAAGASAARPVPAAGVAAQLDLAASEPLASGAIARLREERGGTGLFADWINVAPALGVDERQGRSVSSVAVNLGSESSRPFAFVDLERSDETRLTRGGAGIRVGKLWAFAGRERALLGGGATGALALNPSTYLDGIVIGTATPLRAGVLGDVSIVGGVGPLSTYQSVEDPWWGYLRVTSRPAPWIQVGVSRAALVGGRFEGGSVAFDPKVYGPDQGSFSASDIGSLLVGRTTQFEDQVIALDVRVSLARAGVPVLAYAEAGWEDADRSWGDPALIAGLLWAVASPSPISLRYEYVAFGSGARLCVWCDSLPAFWYQHTRFQSGWQTEDGLLGHPLGGYGRQHTMAVAGWSTDGRIRADFRISSIRRDRWNLIEGTRPGSATRVEGGGAWRLHPRAELAAGWSEESGDGWRERRWRIGVTGLL